MNITQEKIDDLNALLKVEVTAEDYQPKVEKVLKDYQKKMNIPGFRPGKVPSSVVRKMYGKAAMLDEINKMVIDTMYEYLGQNNIDILGNPLPNKEKSTEIDWDNQTDFEFYYDLALSPDITLEPLENIKVKKYNIAINDELVDKYMTDIRRRYGKYSNPEVIADEDLIYAEFTELDESGNLKEGGIINKNSIALDLIKNKTSRKKFIGLKKDDTLDVDIRKMIGHDHEVSHLLGVDEAKVAEIHTQFRLKIMAISRVELAEMNNELFEKVYKNDNITSEEQLRVRIKQDAEISFAGESDKKFVSDIVEELLHTNVILPEVFLKRWLLETNQEKFTEEQIEKEFSVYADSLKWQLIENKLMKENNIEVTQVEVKDYVKNYFKKSMPMGDNAEFPDDKLDDIANRMLQNKEESKRIYDKLYDDKMKDLFNSRVKIKTEDITYDDFVKLASAKHEHNHDHDHDHQH